MGNDYLLQGQSEMKHIPTHYLMFQRFAYLFIIQVQLSLTTSGTRLAGSCSNSGWLRLQQVKSYLTTHFTKVSLLTGTAKRKQKQNKNYNTKKKSLALPRFRNSAYKDRILSRFKCKITYPRTVSPACSRWPRCERV